MAEQQSEQQKVQFVSPAWIEIATQVLEELVAEHGEDGHNYSVCEAFAEAPADFADENGFASWYFYVEGKSVTVGAGRVDDADIQIQATWELALPGARTVYTPELLKEWEENPPQRPDDPNQKVEGDMAGIPSYLSELHNRLAVLTA